MKISGIGAAKGLAVGPVVIVHELPPTPKRAISTDSIPVEKERLARAIERARTELNTMMDGLSQEIQEILSAQLLFLEDPELLSSIDSGLGDGKGIEWAVEESASEFAQLLASLDDEYLRERSSDIRDLGHRLLAALQDLPAPGVHLHHPAILVARDLTPSATASLDASMVLGFATELGGPTSHSAIMARAMGLPALVGVPDLLSSVEDGDVVVLDANRGEMMVNPADDVLQHFQEQAAQHRQSMTDLKNKRDLPAVTTDGHRVELAANIGGIKDVPLALEWGAEGVGLFRTEFLYMENTTLPSEEVQFDAYRKVAEAFAPRPVIFRTLDIGGDKALPYMNLPSEENPFLGYRALRMCLDRPDLFKTQLRALLRASEYGNVRIMFPMVATLDELRRAKQLLQEAAEELGVQTLPEVGIMVEIPSVALMAHAFAPEVDFFSIGSNDLIQYTMAADRGNKAVSYLYQHAEPAVLQLVARVIQAAHDVGKWIGMCGEMAGDPEVIPILVGMGLDEFSMSASSLPVARDIIQSARYADCSLLSRQVLVCRDVKEVRALLKADLQPAVRG